MSTLTTPRSSLSGGTTIAVNDFLTARNRAIVRLLGCLDLLRGVGIAQPNYRVAVQSCTAPGINSLLPGELTVNDRDLAFLPHHRGMEDEIRRIFSETFPTSPSILAAEHVLLQSGLTNGLCTACQDVLNRPTQLMLMFFDIPPLERRIDLPSVQEAFIRGWLQGFLQTVKTAQQRAAGKGDVVAILQQYARFTEDQLSGKADGFVQSEIGLVGPTYSAWALRKILYVFDFDDTLAVTHAKVGFKNEQGQIVEWIDSGEWARRSGMYPNDRFDYTQFQQVIQPQEIKPITQILKNVYAKRGSAGAAICTARGGAGPAISEYLSKQLGVYGIHVECMSGGNKGTWIASQIEQYGYTRICFFDDAQPNLDAVRQIRARFPFIEIYIHKVTAHPS
jgi:hypothetical protein